VATDDIPPLLFLPLLLQVLLVRPSGLALVTLA
jgi:hypothetical protein